MVVLRVLKVTQVVLVFTLAEAGLEAVLVQSVALVVLVYMLVEQVLQLLVTVEAVVVS